MENPLTRDEALDLAFDALIDGVSRANEARTEDAAALNNLAVTALALAQFLPSIVFEHDDSPIPSREWN